MTSLTDINLVRCVVIGDEHSGKETMMKKYAAFSGVPYNSERHEVVTAFNGRKCIFADSNFEREGDWTDNEPHVFLLCVSVASRSSLEETVMMILDTVIERIQGVPFVLVGTQIDRRLSMLIENYGCGEVKYLPMPLKEAESFAKRVGASKYLECSEVTGEGLDEVFEEAFEIGHNHALEQLRGMRRKISRLQEQEMEMRKPSCITQ